VTGNTVIDALLQTARTTRKPISKDLQKLLLRLNKDARKIIFMTAHRRENFGKPLQDILAAVRTLAEKFPEVHWVYPVHPNPHVLVPARAQLRGLKNVHLLPPLGYSDAVWLLKKCALVVTDSGGLQEEAPALGKPVLVLREVTERPEAVKAGTVKLVGANPPRLIHAVSQLLTDTKIYKKMAAAVNPYGDGKAAQRIQAAVLWYFKMSNKKPEPFKP
jgi:UDP-N-acetylglucosamine 2-epimerase (non-hydrolysing)